MANSPGRPRLFKAPEDFDRKVEEYNDYCKANDEPVTWTGLALFLGFSCRASIDEYAKYDGFSYSVKRAKALVEYAYEKRLYGASPTGAIFALKNFGWRDQPKDDGEGNAEPLSISFEVSDPVKSIKVTKGEKRAG